MSGIIEMYSMDEIIAELELETGYKDQFYYLNQISNAIQQMGLCSIYTKTECIDVIDGIIQKPCDYIQGIDMNFIGNEGYLPNYTFEFGASMRSEENSDFVGSIGNSKRIIVSEQGQDVLRVSKQGNELNKVEIKYYAYPVDEYGDMMIISPIKEAVKAWVMWKIKLRMHFANPKSVRKSELDAWEQTWYRLRRKALGEIKMPDPLQSESILSSWVSRIAQFQKKKRKRTTRLW